MKKVFYSLFALALSAMTFTSCEDVPMPYGQPGEGGEEPVVVEPTGNGTVDNPYNVAAALEYIESLGADVESPTNIYIKGKIVSITEEFGTQYGNATYYISDDGTNRNQFYVYRSFYLGNNRFKDGDTQIQEGDDVVICGKVVNFRGTTPETVQSQSYLYSINSEGGGGGGGEPTAATEVNCAKAVELTNALADNATSSEVYAVTGYITEVVGSVSRNQQTFWMADTKDGGRVFEAYYADLPDGVSEFKKGTKVKVTGSLTKYVNSSSGAVTPEIKNAKVEILENGDDSPQTSGTEITCAKAVELTNALADNATSSEVYTVTGYITEVVGSVSRNQQTFWMADTKDGGRVFEAYWADLPDGVSEFKAGSKVKITGNLTKYVNSSSGTVTPEIKNAKVEILEDNGGGNNQGGGSSETTGNVTKSVDGAVVTLVVNDVTAGSSVTVDLNAQGWKNAEEVKSLTLEDGTVIAFAVSSEGGTTPKFYDGTKGVRLYAKNRITITGKDKGIAKVVLNCDTYQGTNYVGNATLTANASGNSMTIVNEHTGTSGGTQLRIQTIDITYAK